MKLKAIIFDFDGVVHNTFELAYQTHIETLGETITVEEYKALFDGNLYENLSSDSGKCAKERSKFMNHYFKVQNEKFRCLEIEGHIKKFLEKMSETYLLFIISSNQEAALEIYFHNNEFTHIFKEVLGVETHTSKITKFECIFDKYDIAANECVFVTDTLGDIREGNKVGIRTIAVDFGFHERKRLEKGDPYKVVSSFEELEKVISAL